MVALTSDVDVELNERLEVGRTRSDSIEANRSVVRCAGVCLLSFPFARSSANSKTFDFMLHYSAFNFRSAQPTANCQLLLGVPYSLDIDIYPTSKMPRPDVDQLDSQIARLRSGGTLTENEVKVLCDKVSI